MKSNHKPKIIVICGPTGIGKTAGAIKLAQKFNGEIVSADSMQIYKYMDIGTAKPEPEETAAVPHHIIDIIEPDEAFDAAMFSKQANEKITELYKRGITPFVAGGTGLYIKALIQGIFHTEPLNSRIRHNLKNEAEKHGSAFLHERLSKLDPDTALRIHPNDTYRIIRALEIYENTGKSISEYHNQHQFSDSRFDVLKIGLHMDREALYKRINQRVDSMIAAGLENEVRMLLDRGYSRDLKSMQSIGYRHMTDFIQGRLEWEEALRTMKRDTRRYAKRQMTWFKADSQIIWTEPEKIEELCPEIKKFLQDAENYIK